MKTDQSYYVITDYNEFEKVVLENLWSKTIIGKTKTDIDQGKYSIREISNKTGVDKSLLSRVKQKEKKQESVSLDFKTVFKLADFLGIKYHLKN